MSQSLRNAIEPEPNIPLFLKPGGASDSRCKLNEACSKIARQGS